MRPEFAGICGENDSHFGGDKEIRQIDDRTKTERLKLLTPTESQRLREEIDRNDW